MSEVDGDRASARLEVVAQLARAAFGPMTALQRMDGLQAVTARLDRQHSRRPMRLAGSALGAVGLVGAITAAVLVARAAKHGGGVGAHAIAYQVEGGEIGDGGYVRSSNSSGTVLRFEEGTEFRLMSGARGRLTSVDQRGARLAIEEGEAAVKVTPRPGAHWVVDAGPFLITVRGTVFTASWNGKTEQLDINMTKGLVSVSGPVADGVLAVRAGQHLTVNMRRKEVVLRPSQNPSGGASDEASDGASDDSAGPPASDEPPAGAPVELADDRPAAGRPAGSWAAARANSTGTRMHAGSAARSWSAALAAGDLDSILADAEHRGLRRALAAASSDDLAALADAARYRRRDDIAFEALLVERRRFPGSTRAHDSAFLVGRMEEARPGGAARALRWYDRYLEEAPAGSYSSEALGRKMTVTEHLRGATAARELAREYLQRFPSGTYAGAARALRDAP